MRLIDADELKKCAIPCQIHNGALTDLCVPLYQVDNAPTVIRPEYARPTGAWIYKEFDAESGISRSYWCSNCGEPKSQWCDDFCQRCGADMRKEQKNDL